MMMSAPVDFQRLFEKSPARYLVLTPELRIAAATDAYLAATKKSRAIIGLPVFDVFPDNPTDAGATGMTNVKAHFDRVLKTGAPDIMPVQKYDIERPAAEGGGFEEHYWRLAGVPVPDDDGVVQYILHFIEDVTERARMDRHRDDARREVSELQLQTVAMEAELHRHSHEQSAIHDALQRALREREAAHARAEAERANLTDFIMEAPASLCLLRGPEHVFEIVNPRYLELVGRKDIVGKTVREALPELAGQGFYELLDGVYTTGQTFVGKELVARLDRGNGALERAFVNLSYQATRGADGAIDGISVYANDVTELVEARDKEKAARAAAEDSEAKALALATEVSAQSRETEQMLRNMRAAKERAEEALAHLQGSTASAPSPAPGHG